jgi:predicted glycoside hydrolase/deacetylase ChbG (UPF0249 family)
MEGEGAGKTTGVVVIVNADDYGYHPSIDRGILQLIQGRCINSISAIVNAANIQDAAEQIKKLYSESK